LRHTSPGVETVRAQGDSQDEVDEARLLTTDLSLTKRHELTLLNGCRNYHLSPGKNLRLE